MFFFICLVCNDFDAQACVAPGLLLQRPRRSRVHIAASPIRAVSTVKLMKIDRTNQKSQEPIGIVISRGSREEATPVFWAYVWGPAPEQDADQVAPKAA